MKKTSLPPIGNRILKSAAGVFLCGVVYFLRGKGGIPFYSMLAVLWCIQPYSESTLKMAAQRTAGTFVGALFGLITIAFEIYAVPIYDTLWGYAFIALMIIPVIYTTVVLDKKNASYFSCVVFLSITVIHMTDSNPFLFVLNRVLDTFIGIGTGIAVNSVRLPRKRIKDTLFAAELDDMLSPVNERLTPYSKVEINRMLSDGANFTLSTMRTPGAITEILADVKMKLPVIVMNGAALYDIKENSYVMAYIISDSTCERIRGIVKSRDMNMFTNALCGDNLMIYYDELKNEAERSIYTSLKRSPYRNYVNRLPSPEDRVIYIMIVDREDKISALYEELMKSFGEQLKIITYPSDDYKGYAYIKIYNKNAGKQKMIEYICESYDIEKFVTLSVDGGKSARSINEIAHELKKSFEPLYIGKGMHF
ncbi:MAG: HAD hydrolase family protein [Oscillospiraceae bacterium]|nr:HAD hydrolase family protein [Oscillospiraceae bacterium]